MCSVALSRPTICDCMDCSRPGSSFHGILQARILEWVAVTSSRGPSQPRDRTHVSCTGGRFFTDWATREYKAEKLLFKENDHINCTKEERAIPLQKTTQKLCVLVISELCFLFFAFFFFLFDFLFSHEIYVKAQQYEYEYEYGRSGDYQPLLSTLLIVS